MNGRHRGWNTTIAALIALLMSSYASVQSIVMQAAMAVSPNSAPMCMVGQMGTAPAQTSSHHDRDHTNICPYCAAAGHAPVLSLPTPVRTPTAFTFTAFRFASSLGPRGPPSIQARARSPPTRPQSLSNRDPLSLAGSIFT